MIDWDRVRELRSEIGEDSFGEVVDLFLEEVEAVINRLGEDGFGSGFANDLHFLKGSAWNLGFKTFGALSMEAERLAVAGEGDAVEINALKEAYLASKQAFLSPQGALMQGLMRAQAGGS